MARKHGPWTIHHTAQVFENAFIEVCQDDVTQPDGQAGQYATVTMKPGVAVLPLDDERQVFLIRQFRYALGRESLETTAGACDDDEPAQQAAARELREELGIEAANWTDLGLCDMDTSIVRCPVRLFLARGLSFKESEREGTETIETVKLSLDEAARRVMQSAITHGPSCALILKTLLYLQIGAPG